MDRADDSTAARLVLPCVLWTGPVDEDGYGKAGGKKAHRVAWEQEHGPIPKGLELDHICVARLCVALYHLDLVTHAENIRRMVERGNHWKQKVTHCPNGHDYSDPAHGVVWDGHRYCRTCRKAQQAERRASGWTGSVPVSCAECGRSFTKVPSSKRRFCSLACKGASQDRKLVCPICGTQLPPLSGKRRACSPACGRQLRSLATRGERHSMSSLSDEKVREIRRLLAEGRIQREVGEQFGVTQPTIGRIARREAWSHVV